MVGRVGGDEFVVLMVNVPSEGVARRKVKHLNIAVRERTIGEIPGGVSVSIGYALTGRQPITYETLFHQADEALYEAKRSGKSRACQYGIATGTETVSRDKIKTILVVDDHALNRKVLAKSLGAEYHIVEAENGRDALEKLETNGAQIDGIVLDLVMPVMDGFEFLTAIRERDAFCNIPIIVATVNENTEHETRALKLGAWDFVTKPYNVEVLKFRLHNAILRSQLSAFTQLKYLAEFDPLTGIYNKRKFFEMTRETMLANPDTRFVFARVDIENFKLVNSYFGMTAGDRLLRRLAGELREYAADHPMMTYGHIQADVFCLCLPFESEEKTIRKIEEASAVLGAMLENFTLAMSFGLYVVRDRTMSVDTMYDNAIMASRRCKGNYVRNYAFYEDGMRATMERENALAGQMPEALQGGQFVVYYQPKYDVRTGTPQGAEALVRWKHPRLGMITPGEFIPVFEKNGLVSKLDAFVWEQACRLLSEWKKEGRHVLPISVNVSRINLYNPKLVEQLCALTQKYDIPAGWLNLEITETAYSENPRVMQDVVSRLQKLGFIIMMDDFGSGYSSLNMLKDLPVDVLKVDMRFLPEHVNGRAERILASVVRMAKWLDMQVIVEGVETEEQVKFLQSVGCDFIQGYFYARPMPESDYRTLLEEFGPKEHELRISESGGHGIEELWSAVPQAEMVFEELIYPVGIYDLSYAGELTLLRANKAFRRDFGYDESAPAEVRRFVDEEQLMRLRDSFSAAFNQQSEVQCEYMRMSTDSRPMWVQVKLKFSGILEGQNIFLAIFSDITAARQAEAEMARFQKFASSPAPEAPYMLIVDDQELSRQILSELFGKHYRILEAEDGKRALELLREHCGEIAVLLLDLIMPVMSGRELLDVKNADPELSPIPVVVISADDTNSSQLRMLEYGVNDYITKPFLPQVALRRVRNVIDYNERFRALVTEYNRAKGS